MAFNAEQKFIYDLFGRKTYGIPRNQRRYVWQERNWEELFEDISYSITSGTSHFLGSFVLKDEGRQNGLPNFTITKFHYNRWATKNYYINNFLG